MLKNVMKEFKTFALKGNVLDMAVGIIIGASFGKIVDSLVKDVMMPPLGMRPMLPPSTMAPLLIMSSALLSWRLLCFCW